MSPGTKFADEVHCVTLQSLLSEQRRITLERLPRSTSLPLTYLDAGQQRAWETMHTAATGSVSAKVHT